ncbi:hypothetical protein RI367_003190 [Sorochytrium milnesiophthora]
MDIEPGLQACDALLMHFMSRQDFSAEELSALRTQVVQLATLPSAQPVQAASTTTDSTAQVMMWDLMAIRAALLVAKQEEALGIKSKAAESTTTAATTTQHPLAISEDYVLERISNGIVDELPAIREKEIGANERRLQALVTVMQNTAHTFASDT